MCLTCHRMCSWKLHCLASGLARVHWSYTENGRCVQLRLRVIEAVRLHLLPKPVFKLKHAFPIFDTGLALHAAYYQPMDGQRLRHIGRSGANPVIESDGQRKPTIRCDISERRRSRLRRMLLRGRHCKISWWSNVSKSLLEHCLRLHTPGYQW